MVLVNDPESKWISLPLVPSGDLASFQHCPNFGILRSAQKPLSFRLEDYTLANSQHSHHVRSVIYAAHSTVLPNRQGKGLSKFRPWKEWANVEQEGCRRLSSLK